MHHHTSSNSVVVDASRELGTVRRRQTRTPGSSNAEMTISHGSRALQALSHIPLHENGTRRGTFRGEHDILDFNRSCIASFTDLKQDLRVVHIGKLGSFGYRITHT